MHGQLECRSGWFDRAREGCVCVVPRAAIRSDMEGEAADVENSELVQGLGTRSQDQQARQARQAQSVVVPVLSTSTVTMTTGCHGNNGNEWTTTTKKVSVVPFVVMTLVQGLYAGQQVLAKVALGSGLDPLFFSVYRNVVAFLFLAPGAFFLERNSRPKMTMSTFGSLNLLAFFGILGNQQLFLLGLTLTTPLFTAVVQNMIPVITFLLAALLGMEKISLRKRSDLARMLGTVICIGGAVTMSIYKGIAIYTRRVTDQGHLHDGAVHMATAMPALDLQQNSGQWFLGVLCLLMNCTSWALYLVNQGSVLQKYPALLSMAAIMELLGSIQVAIVGVAYEGFRCLDLRLITTDQFIIILYGGIVTSGINLVLQAWCVKEVGPFLVSLFNPVQTLIVAFLVILVLGDTLYMGVLIGGILIIGGFYIVICGQQMERRRRNALALICGTEPAGLDDRRVITKQSDLEEPLLS